jgi:hypothetical protein
MTFKQSATEKETDNEITELTPAELAECSFTVVAIDRKSTPDNDYHPWQWQFTIELGEDIYTFCMNPSDKRNRFFKELKDELPAKNMTLVEKQFRSKDGKGELITYHELKNKAAFTKGTGHKPKKINS